MKLYLVEIVEPIKMSVGILGDREKAVKWAKLQHGECTISEYDLDQPHPPMNVVFVTPEHYKDYVTTVNKDID